MNSREDSSFDPAVSTAVQSVGRSGCNSVFHFEKVQELRSALVMVFRNATLIPFGDAVYDSH